MENHQKDHWWVITVKSVWGGEKSLSSHTAFHTWWAKRAVWRTGLTAFPLSRQWWRQARIERLCKYVKYCRTAGWLFHQVIICGIALRESGRVGEQCVTGLVHTRCPLPSKISLWLEPSSLLWPRDITLLLFLLPCVSWTGEGLHRQTGTGRLREHLPQGLKGNVRKGRGCGGKHRFRSTVNCSDQIIVFRQDVAHLVLKQRRTTFLLF